MNKQFPASFCTLDWNSDCISSLKDRSAKLGLSNDGGKLQWPKSGPARPTLPGPKSSSSDILSPRHRGRSSFPGHALLSPSPAQRTRVSLHTRVPAHASCRRQSLPSDGQRSARQCPPGGQFSAKVAQNMSSMEASTSFLYKI